MTILKKQYRLAKQRAINFMAIGDLNAYFKALQDMNHYKKLITVVANN